ncbi:MAG: hypothetical protein H3C58_09490, partial [Fimbriimonadaceae bacterium]|nr:hypothetical protein [Fimbriimonadaceae bacterium]
WLEEQALASEAGAACVGIEGDATRISDLADALRDYDVKHQRPKNQWWMGLRETANMLAKPGPAN